MSGGQRLTILLVEDEPLIALTLVDLIEELGHEPVEATTAAEAVAVFRERPDIDVLVTDIGLPDMPGDQLARILRDVRAELPVVFATGHLSPMPGQEERADPPTVRITKPFQIDDLEQALRRVREGRKA